MNKVEKIKLPEKLGFMAFSTSSNIVFNFKSLYYLIFLTNVLKVPVLTAGTIVTLGTVWDAVNDPLIGFYSVNHTFKSGEKIRPFALYFAIPWAISVVLMFTNFHTTGIGTIALCLLIYFAFEAFYTFLCMPYNSMGALATNNDDDRRSINAFRSLGGCLGSGIGAVAITPLVKMFGGLQGEGAIIGAGDTSALFKTACLMAAICIFGCLVHYFTTKERVKQIEEDDEKVSILTTFKMLFGVKSWIYNMLYILGYGINTAIVMSSINYYAAYILRNSSAATPILASYLVVSILTSLFIGYIDKPLGRKKTMILGAAVQILGKIPFIINPYSVINIYINAITIGFGSTIVFIMFNTNRNNITDIVEYKYKKRIDAMVSTGDNLISKTGEAIAVQLMTLGMSTAGFDADLLLNQTPETLTTICNLLGIVPCVIAVFMTIVAILSPIEEEMKLINKK